MRRFSLWALVLAALLSTPVRAQERFLVHFRFTPSGSPRTVTVVGSFNGWNHEAAPLSDPDKDGRWEATLELEPGVYSYKFLVDGRAWYPDPAAEEQADDNFGGVNSLVRVGQVGQGSPSVALRHGVGPQYRNLLPDGRVRVRLRTSLSTPARAWAAVTPSGRFPLEPGWTDGAYRYPEAVLPAGTKAYRFRQGATWLGASGLGPAPGEPFAVEAGPPFQTPGWVPRSVFYQVFPERFANGDPSNDPPGTRGWGERPEVSNFMGGDLRGILGRLPELEELGVGALYLNPIFQAPTNHKYDTSDYLRIDPAFGTEEDLRALVQECRKRGIRIILDGVFNHSGTGLFAFQDLLKCGEQSPYRNWYFVKSFPVQMEPKPTYEAWWGFSHLPKLNTGEPAVRSYLLEVAVHWIRDFGVAGWRLDVPNEVPHAFWRDFRRAVKGADPEAYITGEIWSDASPWLQGDQFDGVMNYPARSAILDLVQGKASGREFLLSIQRLLLPYPEQAQGCLLNLLGSHDTPRLATLLGGDPRRLALAEVLQFTLPGTPMIYYGDEIGMEGDKDPDCRRCFPVDPGAGDRQHRERLRRLVALRKALPVLAEGSFRPLYAQGAALAFERRVGDRAVRVAVNAGQAPATVPGLAGRDLLSGQAVDGLLPPGTAVVVEPGGAHRSGCERGRP